MAWRSFVSTVGERNYATPYKKSTAGTGQGVEFPDSNPALRERMRIQGGLRCFESPLSGPAGGGQAEKVELFPPLLPGSAPGGMRFATDAKGSEKEGGRCPAAGKAARERGKGVVPPAGLEPATRGLRIRCSAN